MRALARGLRMTAALLVISSCAGPERTAGPTSPSAVATPWPRQVGEAGSAAGLRDLGELSTGGNILTRAVSFPPRNEPLDFGIQLDNLYRDTLKRETVSAFVDLEGRVVWLQEYLQYRVKGCAHADAISRVFSQIRDGSVRSACTGARSGQFPVPVPPRDQSLDFGLQLNEFYRDSLSRTAVSTYVDLEGSFVWTREYLWYRVNGCGHSDAVNRVFMQINGGGTEQVCGPSGLGYWDY